MGNINFSANAGFSWYCILLVIAGIAMLVTGVIRYQPMARRVIRIVLGLGFVGYGFYLVFIFRGGHYILFFQAFIVPILVIADALRTTAARRRLRASQP
jgi:ABC-type iron transport system FetAB permease component